MDLTLDLWVLELSDSKPRRESFAPVSFFIADPRLTRSGMPVIIVIQYNFCTRYLPARDSSIPHVRPQNQRSRLMKLSVIMPARNEEGCIVETIQGVLQ